ncbi:MAG: LPS export ABC transporter periplasmic protein LptC [Deltaproteobacteria bacterium]|nr:LPS export ABC transporter periplasmic protein LptC [Deltaproteobacteria bacterium]MBW1924652.1 LPS export ABC transporter periplasmic protein LptC [Deltaproteobacteria bacterium]MBW1950516.1 LPS export ABC transporter periplasmic protein LptC [Deltaproteobacteria bacterium]MBW2008515.1 LPS export ABC transporter periplasmic protein LptC [Deltaproteobacteria bacterium]MBW2103053.1 LPS export ABC transporter periplasmic protein LptC [Deltaproteobacteria bacterium]
MRGFLKRHWPLAGVFILLLVAATYLIRAGGVKVAEPLLNAVVPGDGLRLKEVHYSQDDPDKKVKWFLDAEEVRFSSDKDFISFLHFHLRLEPEDRPFMELKGEKGDYSRSSGTIRLRGDLRGRTGNGYRVFAERLLVNEKEGRMSSDGPIRIEGPFFSIRGIGLEVDLNRKTLRVLSEVTTRILAEALTP